MLSVLGAIFFYLVTVCVEMAAVSNRDVTAAMLPTDNEEIHGAAFGCATGICYSGHGYADRRMKWMKYRKLR
jgi:hypothetical protein